MDAREAAAQLQAIASDPDFAYASNELTDGWGANGAGLDVVEAVLRFMETHPDIDYGTPGALVHFVERRHHRGYEDLLLASLSRRPTPHTAWMLNRLINGTRDPEVRRTYVAAMRHAARDPATDAETSEAILDFVRDDA
ncbi:MAG: hypothetical protein K8T90_19250 [Planctomycetes bacterium]|nr:hypothetical protein [Planctomycetota bacterium]